MSPLPPFLRKKLEDGFQAGLSEISLRCGKTASALCMSRGARGLTWDQQIFVAGKDPEDPTIFPVVAHEVAHALQKRLPGPACEADAEAEARTATVIVSRGGRVRLTKPSSAGYLSRWGEVGHYYTVYLVMLAAGVAEADAASIAFFAQLPDEASQLDAIPAGATSASTLTLNAKSQDVQVGLHALSGLTHFDELARRLKIFNGLSARAQDFLFAFGLACHPFGDCFAHQKDGVMYGAPFGHLVDGHDPDTITLKTFKNYSNYVTLLHGIAAAKLPGTKTARMPPGTLVEKLRGLTAITTDTGQALFVRNLAASLPNMGLPIAAYDPLTRESRPIWELRFAYPAYFQNLPIDPLERALALAREWRFTSAR